MSLIKAACRVGEGGVTVIFFPLSPLHGKLMAGRQTPLNFASRPHSLFSSQRSVEVDSLVNFPTIMLHPKVCPSGKSPTLWLHRFNAYSTNIVSFHLTCARVTVSVRLCCDCTCWLTESVSVTVEFSVCKEEFRHLEGLLDVSNFFIQGYFTEFIVILLD